MVMDITQSKNMVQLAEIPLQKAVYKFEKSSLRNDWSENHVQVKILALEDGYFFWNHLSYMSKSNRTLPIDAYTYMKSQWMFNHFNPKNIFGRGGFAIV